MTDNPDDIQFPGVSFPDSFTPESRRALITFTISRYVSEGVSKTKALAAYRAAGIGINSSDFSAIYDSVKEENFTSEQIQKLGMNDIPQLEDMGKSRVALDKQFRFTAQFVFNDIEAEVQKTQFLSADTNVPMTKEQLIDFFRGTFGDSFNTSQFELVHIEIVRGYYQ